MSSQVKQNNRRASGITSAGIDFAENESAKSRARVYEAPVLIPYGDVRDVTLGPTIGLGESGNEFVFRVPI